MRAIDADGLIARWKAAMLHMVKEADGRHAVSMEILINDLKKAPTLDYKDLVPQGEWIWNEECECWCCSRCEASALNNYRGLSVDSNFCPNCGARMKNGETLQ